MLYELIFDVIPMIIGTGILIWMGLFLIKLIHSSSKRKNKILEKGIESFERRFKIIYSFFFLFLAMLIKMIIAIILAIGSKPIILKLNYPLGEGYAEFASYVVAIALYMILPDFYKLKNAKETS